MLLISPSALSQDFTGIRGTVRDPSNAAVVGVTIVAKEEAKGFTHQTLSNDVGEYELRGILPGTYTVTAELSGFKKFENRGSDCLCSAGAPRGYRASSWRSG